MAVEGVPGGSYYTPSDMPPNPARQDSALHRNNVGPCDANAASAHQHDNTGLPAAGISGVPLQHQEAHTANSDSVRREPVEHLAEPQIHPGGMDHVVPVGEGPSTMGEHSQSPDRRVVRTLVRVARRILGSSAAEPRTERKHPVAEASPARNEERDLSEEISSSDTVSSGIYPLDTASSDSFSDSDSNDEPDDEE